MTDELTVDLDEREMAEARRLGLTPEAMRGHKAVEVARIAEQLGMTVPQYVSWSSTVDQAMATRGGVTLAEWQRSRDERQGR